MLAAGLHTVDWFVVGGYMVVMLAVGFFCRNINSNISDYVRMGCKSTWWLMGFSLFMQFLSCLTLTGDGAMAYKAGWSALLIGWLGALGLFMQGVLFAPWLRRLRAVTPGDAIYTRFGRTVEQIFVWNGMLSPLIWGGSMLMSMGVLVSAIFDVDATWVILISGVVVVFYSVSGGSWSVQITDNLQAFVFVPVAIVVTYLALDKIGGLDAMFQAIKDQGLTQDFMPMNGADHVYQDGKTMTRGYFTTPWIIAMGLNMFLRAANPQQCWRYLSAKDEKAARNAACFAAGLMFLGSFIWFIPPIIGRLLYADGIMGLNLNNPVDGAYAFVAREVLPPGVLGLVLIALMAATMSSMDSNLTGSAGLVTKNIYPPLCRLFKWKQLEGKPLLRLTQAFSLFFGIWAVGMALLLYQMQDQEFGVYDMAQNIAVLFGLPVTMPFVLSFFDKKIPPWGPLVGAGCGILLTGYVLLQGQLTGLVEAHWPDSGLLHMMNDLSASLRIWHVKTFAMIGMTIIPTFLTRFFWGTVSENYKKEHVEEFFRRIHTPIDFKKEVGREADSDQLKLIGMLGMIMGLMILPLVFFSRFEDGMINWPGVYGVIFIVAFVCGISGFMYLAGHRKNKALLLDDNIQPDEMYQPHHQEEQEHPLEVLDKDEINTD